MALKRKIEGVIYDSLADKHILAIVGPGKCGKTLLPGRNTKQIRRNLQYENAGNQKKDK